MDRESATQRIAGKLSLGSFRSGGASSLPTVCGFFAIGEGISFTLRLRQRLEDIFCGFGARGTGRIDIGYFSFFIDGTIFDAGRGNIHQPKMLDAGGLFLIPPADAADNSGALPPTTIAQIKCAARINLIMAQQFSALKDMIVVLKARGEIIFIEERQPGLPACGRKGRFVSSTSRVK